MEGTDFGDFFRDFYGFLGEVELVALVLDDLTGPPPTTPSGRDDLIVSMADVYASTFLHGPDGEPWRFSAILDTDTQLKEVAFNATEFRHGLAFRFQKSTNRNAPIGNRLLSIHREDAAKIRMADIVAASSAFPGGFEPLSFPYDFHWPGGEVPPRLKELWERLLADWKNMVADPYALLKLRLPDEELPLPPEES